MIKHPVEIKESSIQGRGVFATRKIAKGEVVWQWDLSHLITQNELALLPEEELHFVCRYDNERYLVNQPPYRFVNHSCDQNTEVQNFCDVAIRDIEPGEELTGNYNDESDGNAIEFSCNCGSPKCMSVVGKDI